MTRVMPLVKISAHYMPKRSGSKIKSLKAGHSKRKMMIFLEHLNASPKTTRRPEVEIVFPFVVEESFTYQAEIHQSKSI